MELQQPKDTMSHKSKITKQQSENEHKAITEKYDTVTVY